VLECRGLIKRYGERTVVDDVGFSIAPGETYGLLGPNGAGKTTTISMLCGLLRRDGGTVRVLDHDLDDEPRLVQGAIGYVPQNLAIYPDLSPVENLRFFGRLHGLRGRTLAARVDDVLGTIGLTERADDRSEEFSGGMKRRLNIGIGLLHEPSLLILDEPTVGVDPQSRDSILASVDQLGASGIAVLYTTHYMEEAERLCDRVGIIDNGLLVAEGSRRDLVDSIGQNDTVHVSGTGDLAAATEALRSTGGVVQAAEAHGVITVMVDRAASRLPSILAAVGAAGVSVTAVDVTEPNLEAVFLQMTGKALRDEA